MKNQILGMIVTGLIGAIVSTITKDKYIPAIIVCIFTIMAAFIYLKHELNNDKN